MLYKQLFRRSFILFFVFVFPLLFWGCASVVKPNQDQIAPAIASVAPTSEATNVAVNTAISASFSEAMDPLSFTTTSFLVTSAASSVSGTVSYSSNTATFTPASTLEYDIQYTATVLKSVKDIAGNQMQNDYSWSFTTVASPDVANPSVSSTSPSNGDVDFSVNGTVSATFNEDMDGTTINDTTFKISAGGNNISGIVSYSNKVATFTPSTALSSKTIYTATIMSSVEDLAGNKMASDYSWSFTTQDITAPQVNSVFPLNQSTGES